MFYFESTLKPKLVTIIVLNRVSKEIITSKPLFSQNWQKSLLQTEYLRKVLFQIHIKAKIGKNSYFTWEIIT